MTGSGWQAIADRFRGCPVLVDRVDSADFLLRPAPLAALPARSVEVVSLSKVLGLPGGGLARAADGPVLFLAEPWSTMTACLLARPRAALSGPGYRELFKAARQAVHPEVLDWLRVNSFAAALEVERRARQQHLRAVLDSALSRGWPAWLGDAVQQGAGPVWAPTLRDRDHAQHWSAARILAQHGVASAVRMFNWSGNPLLPLYEPCLAVPIHGDVPDFRGLVRALTRPRRA
jgi:hypothetical protein